MPTIELFRPVGQKELDLIIAAGNSAFPPRLPEQPIFYPVLNIEYATQIARDWNARHNADRVGYVTKFKVKTDYLERFEVQTVGGSQHQEYWIPSEELAEFNANIVGKIEVIATYRNTESWIVNPRFRLGRFKFGSEEYSQSSRNLGCSFAFWLALLVVQVLMLIFTTHSWSALEDADCR